MGEKGRAKVEKVDKRRSNESVELQESVEGTTHCQGKTRNEYAVARYIL